MHDDEDVRRVQEELPPAGQIVRRAVGVLWRLLLGYLAVCVIGFILVVVIASAIAPTPAPRLSMPAVYPSSAPRTPALGRNLDIR